MIVDNDWIEVPWLDRELVWLASVAFCDSLTLDKLTTLEFSEDMEVPCVASVLPWVVVICDRLLMLVPCELSSVACDAIVVFCVVLTCEIEVTLEFNEDMEELCVARVLPWSLAICDRLLMLVPCVLSVWP